MTDSILINFKQKSEKKGINKVKEKAVKMLKIKFILFFIINLILLVIFWFYLACFCAVYKNTQMHLIKDTFISLGTSMIYPFGIYIIPGTFRRGALTAIKNDKECMFKLSKALQLL